MKKLAQKKLYVIRHADALPGSDDAVRPLSKKGRKQSSVIGAFLKRIGVSVDAVWQSELLRAQQTAEIIAKEMRPKTSPLTIQGLGPDDSVPALHKRLDAFNGNLMIVGHAPSLPALISSLLDLARQRQIIDLKKGGVVCFKTDDSGKWTLLWCVEPDICK